MSMTNYTELQTAVANWLHRSDLTAQIPDFITMAEENLSADISSRSMDVKTSLATVAGTSTVALPTDMVEMRRLQIVSSYNVVLKYLSPDELSADYNANLQAIPQVFTVTGGNIELAPIPDAVYNLELTYKQRIPPLASNSTNWLLTAWPSAYLYGSILAAQPYIQNDTRLPVIKSLYDEAVRNINMVDWYSGSTMRVKVR